MQVDKCYFPSNLPRQAVSSPESGRESNMVRAEILYFLGSSVYRWGTSDSGFRPRQPVAVYTFRRGYPSFRGKNLPDPAQSSALSRSDQWHAVTASLLGWTLDAFDFFVLVFLMDTLAAHFHVDKSKIVETLFFTLVMRPVGALIFGLLADRYGRRKPLMANVVFFSVIELLCGFAPNYTVFLILRTIYGIGMGGEWGVGASLAMENAPAKWRGVLSGIVQSGYCVAICWPRWRRASFCRPGDGAQCSGRAERLRCWRSIFGFACGNRLHGSNIALPRQERSCARRASTGKSSAISWS